jgi:serpin B
MADAILGVGHEAGPVHARRRLDDRGPDDARTARRPYSEGRAGAPWSAVRRRLALTIIVPDDLATFEASLTRERLADVTAGLADHTVNLSLPKFGTESKVDLKDILVAMGMPAAFDPNLADFSGITREEQLYITAVIHQANIDVDEKGTTAAAATAVVMGRTSAPGDVVTLRVDRPFLFALRDVPTGTILFLGRVLDPSIAAS